MTYRDGKFNLFREEIQRVVIGLHHLTRLQPLKGCILEFQIVRVAQDCSPCYCLDPWGKFGNGVRVCETRDHRRLDVAVSWICVASVCIIHGAMNYCWILQTILSWYREKHPWNLAIRMTFVRPRLDLYFTSQPRDDKDDRLLFQCSSNYC